MAFAPCPVCNRKGLHYAGHPHALGFKDHGRAQCRFCWAEIEVIDPWRDTLGKVLSGVHPRAPYPPKEV